MQPVDIVILSNGPGELATWVRPVVKNLRMQVNQSPQSLRISVILSPCTHSTGQESAIALSYPEVDRVLAAKEFFSFLLWGKTKDNWDWRERGMVIFLGGDQFYTVVIGKRLGYSTLIYAEWDARWYRWIDYLAAMNQQVVEKVPAAYHHKFTVVGDLIADVSLEIESNTAVVESSKTLIGLLVGSKPAKLFQGVPLCLAIAEAIHQLQPQVEFIIPVAPTLTLETLAQYADSQYNPLVSKFGGVSGRLITSKTEVPHLITAKGTKIELITQFPAYETLTQCQLCLTTVGANTAELASLAIPMIVMLPTQQLDAMRSWDGIPGILANLPLIGSIFAKIINWLILRQKRLFAWPNIWAGTEIVPELVGQLQGTDIAKIVVNYLDNPSKLEAMRDRLLQVRGKPGASHKIAAIVRQKFGESQL